ITDMLSPNDERSDKLALSVKKKLHKYQTKKDGLEQENIRLKEKLFKAQEKMEWMDHEITTLRDKNSELQKLFGDSFLSDGGESIIFSDSRALEAYEKEERALFRELKKRLHDLKERYRIDSVGMFDKLVCVLRH
ncbi:hypothetical protein INT47_004280, partial [Mucor saturninus]